MAFCKNCGTDVPANAVVCPNCGTAVAPAAQPNAQQYAAPQYAAPQYSAPQYAAPPVVQVDPQDVADTKNLAALSYLGITFIFLALVAAPNSKFTRYHVNQAVILVLCRLIVALCLIIPFLGWIVGGIANIAIFVFAIMGIVAAAKGEAKEVPLVGKFRIIKF